MRECGVLEEKENVYTLLATVNATPCRKNANNMKFSTCISRGEICKWLEFQHRHITRACGVPSNRYLRLGDFDNFKFDNCVFLVVFFKKRSVMSRRKQRSAFDQVSEFDCRRVVAYRVCDSGLSFR
ncbi:uncharacterized protein TNCV_3577311 [Trichonephila clavipes]|uniref:Uncharacterized protein n=1 Tax=Trichonephila clavipes TaxID=2585209 RepID=A0A8X6RB83_TRICX|nr:uncharacterized protein TNCV_3577311 [Trichonephila clavipes]